MIVRPAVPMDAPDMVALLNQIIATGGTTAHQTPFDEAKMLHHYIAPTNPLSCQVAQVDGKVLGFQWLGWPDTENMPEDWAIIASFVATKAAGKGIGQHLFDATLSAAKSAGVSTIDATIRADNVPGLRYYGGLGFVDYDRVVDLPLADGTVVDRICKRFDISGV